MLKYLKIAALVACFAPGVVHAMPVSLFEFKASGTVVSNNVPANGFKIGDAASISFVFDANTPVFGANTPLNGDFSNPNVGDIVSVLGSETFRSSGSFASLTDNDFFRGDEFRLTIDSAATDSGNFSALEAQILLNDSDKTAITSIKALPTNLLLSDFQGQFETASISFTGVGVGTIRADITSLSITPVAAVPLPATMPMMLLGLGLVGVFLRRRKA